LLLPEFGFDKGWKWDQVEDHVDEEQCRWEYEGDSEVEPTIHEHMQLVTLISVLLLKIMSAIDIPETMI
jgi:hypothetical protein